MRQKGQTLLDHGKNMLLRIIFGIICLSIAADGAPWNDPCNLMPPGPRHSSDTVDVTVPASCHNGTFDWNYPQGTINVIFPNPNGLSMSVCLKNYIGGHIFTIHDVTGGTSTLIEISDRFFSHSMTEKESCTAFHSSKITLKFKAPPNMYYMGAVEYRLKL